MNKHLLVAALAVVLTAVGTANATSYTWSSLGGGSFNWDDANNWGGTAYPNLPGDVANIGGAVTAATTVRAPAAGVTAGILNYGATTTSAINLLGTAAGGTDKLIFDNGGAGAQINYTGGPTSGNAYVYGNIQLNDNLTITNTDAGAVERFYTVFTGGKAMTIASGALSRQVYFNPGVGHSNNFGSFTISNLSKAGLSGNSGLDTVNCDISILGDSNTDCIQQYVSEVINDHATVSWTGARKWNMAGCTETIGAVSGGNYAWVEANSTTGTLILAGPFDGSNKTYLGEIGDGESGSPGAMTLIKRGAFMQTLAGSGSDDLAHARVEAGVLALSKASGATAVGEASFASNDLTLGDGVNLGQGEVRLLAANQIVDSTALLFKGGIFNANGFGEAMGAASLLANSTLDMAAGLYSVVSFADSSAASWTPGQVLTIKGWDGSLTGGGNEQVLFGASAAGLTADELAEVSFLNPAGMAPGSYGAQILGSGEVVPVPEPVTLGLVLVGGLLAIRRRK